MGAFLKARWLAYDKCSRIVSGPQSRPTKAVFSLLWSPKFFKLNIVNKLFLAPFLSNVGDKTKVVHFNPKLLSRKQNKNLENETRGLLLAMKAIWSWGYTSWYHYNFSGWFLKSHLTLSVCWNWKQYES